MDYIDLSYEKYAGGYIIADYSNDSDIRFCGKSFDWSNQPIVRDCFETEQQARDAATNFFIGKD